MIERDYIVRLIQEFMAAIARFLEKKEASDDDLRDLYRQYVGPYDTIRNLTFDETMQYASDQWDDEHRLPRLDMLAQLLFAEGMRKQNPLRDMLLRKSYRLFDYLEQHDNTFNITRKQRMQQLRTLLPPQ